MSPLILFHTSRYASKMPIAASLFRYALTLRRYKMLIFAATLIWILLMIFSPPLDAARCFHYYTLIIAAAITLPPPAARYHVNPRRRLLMPPL